MAHVLVFPTFGAQGGDASAAAARNCAKRAPSGADAAPNRWEWEKGWWAASSVEQSVERPIACELFACVLFDNARACITSDMAAPVEFAIATLFDDNLFGVVAAAAAQNGASVQSRRCLTAYALVCACNNLTISFSISPLWGH